MADKPTYNGDNEERIVDDALLAYLQGEPDLPAMEAFENAAVRNPEHSETIVAYSAMLDSLSGALSDVVPPMSGSLRGRVLSIADEKPISKVVRMTEGEWLPSGMPGFDFKVLFQHPETKRYTVIARIAPGGRMPHHRHRGMEECLIIKGSLWTDGVLLKEGDYIVTEDGTEHEDTWSPDGALALLTTFLDDEILAG